MLLLLRGKGGLRGAYGTIRQMLEEEVKEVKGDPQETGRQIFFKIQISSDIIDFLHTRYRCDDMCICMYMYVYGVIWEWIEYRHFKTTCQKMGISLNNP